MMFVDGWVIGCTMVVEGGVVNWLYGGWEGARSIDCMMVIMQTPYCIHYCNYSLLTRESISYL